ncbi:MAG: agmatine deiminase family protein [Glaciecola sp.]|jgi:agmatine/peptidylarginine deiminase|nr:agmatine deiminase family protein [Glaciecola sp.]MDG1816592.1 agmatine deiminase family protein [Glaciecola sp.]MDG2098858.1 agmatine deiminase family protein [Glaciecola sp.]
MTYQLLPEWVTQEAVILAWPHQQTDWAPWLQDTRCVYLDIITHISQSSGAVVLLVVDEDIADVQQRLHGFTGVLIVPAQFNDTWVRDYGFLTVEHDGQVQPIEFEFNGWAEKYAADLDTQVNRRYLAPLLTQPLISYPEFVEGGALEIDGNGHLLSTAQCLLHPQRNPQLTEQDYHAMFSRTLGAQQSTILQHGHLENDDTDGHIDTLARFTLHQGIVYQGANNRPTDPHFAGLEAMAKELQQAFPAHTLFSLPLPHIMDGVEDVDNIGAGTERLPASYANFLIFNDLILAPIYGVAEDEEALSVLTQAYPHHQIIPVNCATLIRQYGSLHCITMQVPQGVIKPEWIAQALEQVTVVTA